VNISKSCVSLKLRAWHFNPIQSECCLGRPAAQITPEPGVIREVGDEIAAEFKEFPLQKIIKLPARDSSARHFHFDKPTSPIAPDGSFQVCCAIHSNRIRRAIRGFPC
jgi:hypothetical protein